MNLFEAIILAIVEGLTEFLPISSTGHMIIASSIMGISSEEFTKLFTVNIQFGAILSVVILYWKRFFKSITLYYKLFVAFVPTAIIAFLAMDYIDMMLENVVVVAISLVVGGVILIFVDNWFKNSTKEIDQIGYYNAFFIGLFQCLAMVPGVSRSAATIIGGLSEKMNRKAAAEFSFLLAVPTMFAASGYKTYKNIEIFTKDNLIILLVGNFVAFVVAMVAIKFFIAFLTKHGFKWFGYYRVAVGIIILVLVALGYNLEIV